MARRRLALIVGAGIGGLAAGHVLRRAGWDVRIFERAAAPRELGFALMLAPNAVAALDELGLSRRVLAFAAPIEVAELRRGDGQLLRRFDFSDLPAPQRAVIAIRPVVHGALLDDTPGDQLTLGAAAVGFAPSLDGVTLRLADGRSVSGDLVIGADGVGSVIRQQLHPDEPPPRTSGYFALRGVVHGADHLLGAASGVFYLGNGLEVGVARAGQEAIYWYMSLRADVVSGGPPDATSILDRAAVGLDPRFRTIAAATKPKDLRLDELFDREPLDRWGAGRVTVLGDAAHPMLPHAGQGAAQALEDAVALGLALANTDDIDVALRRYERVRAARTRGLIRLGRRISRTTMSISPTLIWLRNTGTRVVPLPLVKTVVKLSNRIDRHKALRAR